MALVPFHVSGAAASQQLSEQFLQVGPYSLLLRQRPQDSRNTAHLQCSTSKQQDRLPSGNTAATRGHQKQQKQRPDLSHVGLVLWQSGYVLADFLLLRLPQLQAARGSCSSGSSWAGVKALELGCGAGTVGMFLALAGAQVVLTDQRHILPLTVENLELNFPQIVKQQIAAPQPDEHTGLGQTVQQQQQVGVDQQIAQQLSSHAAGQGSAGVSVIAALAAVFCGSAAAVPAAAAPHGTVQHVQKALELGPLVVEYTWGEAAHVLQQKVAAAAAARLGLAKNYDSKTAIGTSAETAPGGDGSCISRATAQQQPDGLLPPEPMQPGCYDMIVGADLLYDSSCHAALLDSLQQVCAAHTEVFFCYRQRSLGEDSFMHAAAAVGWAVEHVQPFLLHPEFQGVTTT